METEVLDIPEHAPGDELGDARWHVLVGIDRDRAVSMTDMEADMAGDLDEEGFLLLCRGWLDRARSA